MRTFILFSFVTTSSVLCSQFRTKGNAVPEDFRDFVKHKRYDLEDRWSWGYAETITTPPYDLEDRWSWGYAETITTPPDKPKYITFKPEPEYSAESPCNPYEPSVPNFWSPGRRVSEAKCDEYIWQLGIRHLKQYRELQCADYILLKQHPNSVVPSNTIGGYNTNPGDYPHMGALGWKASGGGTWVFKCGSALISPKFLLTAAHCSRTLNTDTSVADPVPKIVRLGDKNIADVLYRYHLPKDENISRIIVHPLYSPPKKYNDIAIIELTREVEFTKYIQPACLYTKFDTSSLGKQVTITGWGVIETTGLKTSPELQAAKVDIIDSAVCNNLLYRYCNRGWCGVQDGQICAGKLAGGVDSCQGDSGGPLQVKIPLNITGQGKLHYLVGVTSFGIGCALPNKPGLYTRVSNYIDWIENTVWP